MSEKKALTRELSQRYQKAHKKEKTVILNEFVQSTGYNRKYALHILTTWGKTKLVRLDGKLVALQAGTKKRQPGSGRKQRYSEAVLVSLRLIWAFFGYRCGKLLAPLLRELMPYLEEWPPFGITAEIKTYLLGISPATIDRRLAPERKKLYLKGISGTKPGILLKSQIPVRVYYPDAEKKAGFFEIDTVHHCGDQEAGDFCLTLDATDVASGWVELRALRNKAHKWVLAALADIKSTLPFPLTGIDSDNGEEFINHALLKWTQTAQIQFTRSRAYHKNDNCFVEQKNDACVRAYVGYYRFEADLERDALAAVYQVLCPLLNYFMPTRKLVSKTRLGSKIKKVYDQPMSPYRRLLASPDLSDEVKAELARRFKLYNPVCLQQEVHQRVEALLALQRQRLLSAQKAPATSARKAT